MDILKDRDKNEGLSVSFPPSTQCIGFVYPRGHVHPILETTTRKDKYQVVV